MLRTNYPSIASKLILDLARVVSLRLRNADKFIVDISNLLGQQNIEEEAPKASKAKKTDSKKAKDGKPAKASKKAEVKEEPVAKVKVKKAKDEKPAKASKKVDEIGRAHV